MLKRLDELSDRELKVESEKAGLEGQFDEVQCIIKLTIYLVKVGKDPFNFQFNIEEDIHEGKAKDLEDGFETLEKEPNFKTVGNAAVASSLVADGMSMEISLVSLPETLPLLGGSSLNSDNAGSALLSSSILADVVSAESVLTWKRFVSSSMMSFASCSVSSSRDLMETSVFVSVFIVDLEDGQPQTCLILKRMLSEGESGELHKFQFESQNCKPVLWPPNLPVGRQLWYFLPPVCFCVFWGDCRSFDFFLKFF